MFIYIPFFLIKKAIYEEYFNTDLIQNTNNIFNLLVLLLEEGVVFRLKTKQYRFNVDLCNAL